MSYLLENEYAPVTTRIGFIESTAVATSRAYEAWQRGLGRQTQSRTVLGSLPELFKNLEPLVQLAHIRRLFVEVDGWTSIFDCGVPEGDPPVAVLSQLLGVRGVSITAAPHTYRAQSNPHGSQGSTQWTLFKPAVGWPTAKPVRTVGASYDAGWTFWAEGLVQPQENTKQYEAKRVVDRFTAEDSQRLSEALGFRAFDHTAYVGMGYLVETNARVSPSATYMTLQEARRRLHLA